LGDRASVTGAVRLALSAAYREEFSFGLKRKEVVRKGVYRYECG
jgi:hypothetical protein